MTAEQRLRTLIVEVDLLAPWLVHGNDPGRLGLDAVQLLDVDRLRRVLPGTLLAGRIRDTWRSLRALGSPFLDGVHDPRDWFGFERAEHSGPSARLHVDDLVEQGDCAHRPLEISTRLQFDSLAGAGADGMLLAIEQREPAGTTIRFKGRWHAWLSDSEATELPRQLAQGLRWQSQLGAMRNIGFGELVRAEVTVEATQAPVKLGAAWPAATPGQALQVALALDFGDRPIAVANRLVNGNLFESGEVVPGATVKAALAHALKKQLGHGPLPEWFNALRITHAQPSAGEKRSLPLPLSLAFDSDHRLLDLAGDPNAAPCDAKGQALCFQPDWKPALWAPASAHQARGKLRRHLRVRTAIEEIDDAPTVESSPARRKRVRGVAKHESLFAYNCVAADQNGSGGQGSLTVWRATLDLPAKHASLEALELLAKVLGGNPLIGPIGKTDAFAGIQVQAISDATPPEELGTEVHLMLASDALLCPSDQLLGHTSTTPLDLTDNCRGSFREIAAATLDKATEAATGAASALTLARIFSRQRMAGGQYLHDRFMRKLGKPYLPYLLFEAGSVFVFTVNDKTLAAQLLRAWCRHGLPLGKSTADRHGDQWDNNPYLPQNGYGEVVLLPADAAAEFNKAELDVAAATASTANRPGAAHV